MHVVLISLLLTVSSPAGDAPDVAVVCPAEFRETMQPWLEHRTKQGHVVRFVSNLGTADEVHQRIREIAEKGKLRFVVLVGDAPPPLADDSSPLDETQRSRLTPTFRVPSKINRYWGGDPDFATDNPYADLDGDGVPDLAIGRLTAHSAEELAAMLKKTLAYEQCRDFGPWRTKINFVAGQGGLGELADAALESVVRKAITSGVPPGYLTTLTYASWHSQYCPDPHAFHDCCLQRLNESALFWVYMGHGSPRSLERAVFPDCTQSILNCDDCRRLRCGPAPPIALFFCCYAGAFAERQDCLAEELLRNPQGPVAVLGGSNVTMPYSMTVLGWEAMHEYFVEHRQTVGELFMYAKRNAIDGNDLPLWGLMSALTAAVTPNYSPKEERREYLHLFNLLGDPTFSLFYPQQATLSSPATAAAGQMIEVRGECPIDGPAIVDLMLQRDRLRDNLPQRDRYSSTWETRQEFDHTYQRANDPRLATVTTQVVNGRFSARLAAPDAAAGACHLRVFSAAEHDCAMGACNIQIVAAAAQGKTLRKSPVADSDASDTAATVPAAIIPP